MSPTAKVAQGRWRLGHDRSNLFGTRPLPFARNSTGKAGCLSARATQGESGLASTYGGAKMALALIEQHSSSQALKPSPHEMRSVINTNATGATARIRAAD